MKAVLSPVPEEILAWRKRTGGDRYDEMWEGVLHMAAVPTKKHDEFQWALRTFLKQRWARPRAGNIATMNVAPPGGWPNDYRIPDLILWTKDRDPMDKDTHFEGPPNVAIEIRSPDDESYEKLEFYGRLGVEEVWVIDRDTKEPEVYVLKGRDYDLKPMDPSGWVLSDFAGVEMRPSGSGELRIRLRGDDSTLESLP
ncbi:MAG: Uma2 family endonuclease [Planctomycetes bacterium]|nr:Uma2 family endonuclease [Planctomycetota bacterium]